MRIALTLEDDAAKMLLALDSQFDRYLVQYPPDSETRLLASLNCR